MKKNILLLMVFILLTSGCLSRKQAVMTNDSMLPSIKHGDLITYTTSFDFLDYADLVLFEFPESDDSEAQLVLFRVVGLPGDSIAIDNHICVINGKRNATSFIQKVKNENALIEELAYLNEQEEVFPNGKTVRIYSYDMKFSDILSDIPTMLVPENHYFLMGDFRSNSNDSRYLGVAPGNKIKGKVGSVNGKNFFE